MCGSGNHEKDVSLKKKVFHLDLHMLEVTSESWINSGYTRFAWPCVFFSVLQESFLSSLTRKSNQSLTKNSILYLVFLSLSLLSSNQSLLTSDQASSQDYLSQFICSCSCEWGSASKHCSNQGFVKKRNFVLEIVTLIFHRSTASQTSWRE